MVRQCPAKRKVPALTRRRTAHWQQSELISTAFPKMNVTLLCSQDTGLQIGILPKVRLLKQAHVAHHARIGNSCGLQIGWTSTPPQLLQKAFWKNCNVGDTYSSVGYDFQGPCVP